MDKLSKIRFPFSTFLWPAKLDISSKMGNTCSPRRLQSVEWSWLYSRISDLWKSSGGLFSFSLNQKKKYFFLFNFLWTGNSECIPFWHPQHMALPTGNNLVAPSSCWLKSTLISHWLILLLVLSSCRSCSGCPLGQLDLPPPPRAWSASSYTPVRDFTAVIPYPWFSQVHPGLSGPRLCPVELGSRRERQGALRHVAFSAPQLLGALKNHCWVRLSTAPEWKVIQHKCLQRCIFDAAKKASVPGSLACRDHSYWEYKGKEARREVTVAGRLLAQSLHLLPFLSPHHLIFPEGRHPYGYGVEKWILLTIFAWVVKYTSIKGNTFSLQDSRVRFIPSWNNLPIHSAFHRLR